MKTPILVFVLVNLLSTFAVAQKTPLLISGPMLGDVNHREAILWLEVSSAVSDIEIHCRKKNEITTRRVFRYSGSLGQDYHPVKMILTNLEPEAGYEYEVYLNGEKQSFDFPLSFQTKKIWERKAPPSFSFTIGSCAYINDPAVDRRAPPYGQDPRIFDSIARNPSDFMLWLGDNVYLRDEDYTSRSGIYYRYSHDRRIPQLKRLLASRPHYAIWDDHDFGPNDANGAFPYKTYSLEAFRDYWGNPGFGEWDQPGIYTSFNWVDADFFLLDDRFYRSDEKLSDPAIHKTYFGEKQLRWLENSLLMSKANFKFIAVGNQVINPVNDFECFCHYQHEWNRLMSFIREYKIGGVVFLSGDRHFTEITSWKPENFYPLYNITSSPLTSSPFTRLQDFPEFNNPARVDSTLLTEQNYIEIEITGATLKERVATVTCYTIENQVAWTFRIPQQDLK
jgi:alkaline phosphatase D